MQTLQSVLGSNPDPAPSGCVTPRVASLALAFFSVLIGEWGFVRSSHIFVLSTAPARPWLGAGDLGKEPEEVLPLVGLMREGGRPTAKKHHHGACGVTRHRNRTLKQGERERAGGALCRRVVRRRPGNGTSR